MPPPPVDRPVVPVYKRRILSQRIALSAARLLHLPWQVFALASLGFSGVAAFGFAPGTPVETVVTHSVVRALPTPVPIGDVDEASVFWHEERMQRGDTIGSLLARAAVD